MNNPHVTKKVVWKRLKQFKIHKNNRKNIQYSGYQIARWTGFFYDKSWTSILNIMRLLAILITGVIHLFLEILQDNEIDLLEKMFVLNYFTLASTALLMALSLIFNSKKMSFFLSIIKTEFYQAKIKLSEKQQTIKEETNHFLQLFIYNILFYYYFSWVANFVRRPLSEGIDMKILPVPGWLPFEVNSWPRYIGVYAYQLLASFSTVNSHTGMLIVFVIHAKLLCEQSELLSIYIQETFENNPEEIMALSERNDKYERFIELRMEYIIHQHFKLLEYFDLFQEVYSMFLFLFSVCAGSMVCTVVYIITDPDSSLMTTVTGGGCVFLTEVIIIGTYCWFGQQLTNKLSKISEVVYFTPWYMESINTQKSLLNILTACNRERIIKGGGIQEFSMKGFSELLQASFSYFNMLKAMR